MSNSIQLHKFQEDCITNTNRFFERGFKAPLNILFTGAGKTEIFIEYIYRHVNLLNERVVIIMPASLVIQTINRFKLRHPEFEGYTRTTDARLVRTIGAVVGNRNECDARIIVASAPTIIERLSEDSNTILRSDFVVKDSTIVKHSDSSRRNLISDRFDQIIKHGMVDYVFWDEAHHAVATSNYAVKQRLDSLASFVLKNGIRTIGFTATPNREDGIALSNVFDCIATQYSFHWGVTHGFLAPPLPPIRIHADIGGKREKTLKVGNWAEIIKRAWIEKGENRITIGYMPTIEDARWLAEVFRNKDVEGVSLPFAYIDGDGCVDKDGNNLSKDNRQIIIDSLMKGETRGVINYGVLLEGVDIPPASCMLWARNAASENALLATQALGRFLRHFKGNEYLPEKKDALILLATENDLSVLTMGSLAGFKIEDGENFVAERLEEEENETNIIEDLRDADKSSIISEGVTYSIAKLIRKSNSDWYDDEDGVLVLSLSQTDALAIIYPNYTLSGYIQQISSDLEQALESSDSDKLTAFYKKTRDHYELFNNFSLWHIKRSETPEKPVRLDESLPMLLNYAIPYSYEFASPVDSFMARSKHWKKQPMTQAQMSMLSNFYPKGVDSTLLKGEAAQLITYNLYYKEMLKPVYEKYLIYGNYLKSLAEKKYASK